jgi:hypothetical protein
MGAVGRWLQQFGTTLAASARRWWWWVLGMGLAVIAALVFGLTVSDLVASELVAEVK